MFEILPKADLRRRGFRTSSQIEAEIHSGRLTHLGHNMYTFDEITPEHVFVGKHRVQLSCLTACSHHGLWTPDFLKPQLHFALPNWRSKEPQWDIDAYCVHRIDRFEPVLANLPDAILQVARKHDPEIAMIVIESAISLLRLNPEQMDRLLLQLPQKRQFLLDYSTLSQSGSETRLRLFLEGEGLEYRQQVQIYSWMRVDFLVGKSLIIECDSRSHHVAGANFSRDRRRDKAALRRGYVTLRLSFQQIWYDWEQTKEDLREVIRRRRHRLKVRA